MNKSGQELLNAYVLEILASTEANNHTLEDLVNGLRVKAQLADFRFEQIEHEVGNLRDVLAKVLKEKSQAA